MKKTISWTLLSILILVSSLSYSQTLPDSIYYKRLFYACKVWGHVKYYHTEVAKGNVNWDNELLNALSGIKNAPDNASFNDTLLVMLSKAGTMAESTADLPELIDSLNNNKDYSWMQDTIFSELLSSKLETIRANFRPQNNVYVGEAWAGGNPTFDMDNLYYSGPDFPAENIRILALFRYWNIINYFFPYKNIMDQDWDTTLAQYLPQIIKAYDAAMYNLVLKSLSAKTNDSHAFYYSPSYWNWLGNFHPPFLARFIENEMVITKVLGGGSELKVGDIIKKIDGEDVVAKRNRLREYAHGSNEVIIDRELNNILTRGHYGRCRVVVDDGNGDHEVLLERNSTNYGELIVNTNPMWKDTLINGTFHIGIVDMGRLEKENVSQMFNGLWNTDAIIFDLRNYPNGTLWSIVNYLYPTSIHIANFTTPDITYPGRLTWKQENIGEGTLEPYQGDIKILFDERTQSQAEYTCMGLEQFPGAIKIGSTTAAADGNTSKIYLPGNIYTYATFLGTYYPDYKATQRIGIIPDFEVHPTISGIRAGKDEVMDFALKNYTNSIREPETVENIRIYPNPVKDVLFYELANDNSVLFELFDIQGCKLITTSRNHSHLGSIDISELKSGLYFLNIISNKGKQTKVIIKE